MQALAELISGYEQMDSESFTGNLPSKKSSHSAVANRSNSQPHPKAKSAPKPSSGRPARPSSTSRTTLSRASSLSTAGSLLAGSGSRPSTPDTPKSASSSNRSGKPGTAQGDAIPERAARATLSPTPKSAARASRLAARVQPPGESREVVCNRISSVPFLEHNHELFMHGRGYMGPKTPAQATWRSTKPPRKDHDAPDWLTATEWQDSQEVARAKCRQLAALMRLSKKTVLYTGAGISASVVGQAALSGQNKVGWKPDKMKAKPTLTHHALGFLGRQGIIHSWVQQNHDGLPQKAGFPQECINEIHGSWYDPCNPVVKYSGTLHNRACPWMENDAETADLVLVLGTSLGGLNADQVATNAAERSITQGALGTVCINLQQTAEDGSMTMRLFGRSDDLLPMLLEELGFEPLRPGVSHWPRESRALVPYDKNGLRVPDGAPKMWLDLTDGAEVRITPGHNIQGAKQPQYMHIGASKPFSYNGTTKQPGVGLGVVKTRDEEATSFMLNIEGASMRLGLWWLDAAARGAVDALPLVNQKPEFEGGRSVGSGRSGK